MMTDSHDRQAEVEEQRRRLREIYQPQTSREAMIIDELARVYQEKEEFERDHQTWMQHEATTALQTIRRMEAEDFLKLQRQWPKAPAAIAPIIGQSINGALWLVEFWQMLVARLSPKAVGPAPGMDQACQALLALGYAHTIQNLSEDGWWWGMRFLAIQQDKDLAIAAWLRKSGTCDRATETQQARHKLYDAPDATVARQELYDEAMRQAAHCAHKLKQLKEAEPSQREAQLARARCMGLKVPGLATCLNNAYRMRDSIHRSIKFFEDRLARIPKEAAAKERDQRQKIKIDKMMRSFFPPEEPLPPPDLGQAVEEAILTDLLPRMAAATAPPPTNRPMSNRKKRLLKMARKEELARSAAVRVKA